MPGEASVTFEVVGAEAREGDLDLVGLTASRFLDGLSRISRVQFLRRYSHVVSPRSQSLAPSRRIKDASLVESQTSIAFPRLLRLFASDFGMETCLACFQ